MGIPLLRARKPHRMENPDADSLRLNRQPDNTRNHAGIREQNRRDHHRDGRRRALVPYRGTNAVFRPLDYL